MLWQDFLATTGRVVHKWKHYFPAYERHLARYVDRPVVLFEIGCGEGGSLQMWRRYLGPHARIVGIDNRADCGRFREDQIEVRIGDQSDPQFLDAVMAEFGYPDVVLDDGSHMMAHVAATFRHLYLRMARDGVYMVEDMHTAYWREYGGGLNREGSFIELCKRLIDELNADWIGAELPPTPFTRSTLSMHFYDSVVAFERGSHTRKVALKISAGGPPTEIPLSAIRPFPG